MNSHQISLSCRSFISICLSFLFFLFVDETYAASSQADILKGLTPAQQALVMQKMMEAGRGSAITGIPGLDGPRKDKKSTTSKSIDQPKQEKKLLLEEDIPEGPPKLKGLSTIIVAFDEAQGKEGEQLDFINQLIEREKKGTVVNFVPAQKRMLYRLDKNGVLELPGVGFIPMLGLTEEEAAARLNVEPLLQSRKITVRLLQLKPIGRAALKPFGHELFDPNDEISMEPAMDIPVPNDYIIGPGDVVYIQLVGNTNEQHYLDVNRDGTLSFPGVGAIPVAGLSFSQMKSELKKRIEKQFIGVNSYIVLGELRTIRVFVLGEVEKPGSYLVSGISTITHALLQAQGLKSIASLRRIELRRDGRLVNTLDGYDLLLSGDARKDVRLEAGDVVLVPPAKTLVSVGGEVRRPAIYELKGGESVKDIVDLAGGFTASAFQPGMRIERLETSGQRRMVDVPENKLADIRLENGDYLSVPSVDEKIDDPVTLSGNVRHPGPTQWRKGMRISDVVGKLSDVKDNTDLDYVVIKRFTQPDYRMSVLSTRLRDVFSDPRSDANILLEPRDEILVLDFTDRRALLMDPVIKYLQNQAKDKDPSQVVRVIGQVRGPGSYPLEKNMRISDLLRAGGQLKESAFTLDAEVTRYVVSEGAPREITHIKVDLDKVLKHDAESDLVLQPFDLLNIKEIPQWTEQDQVEIVGEVKFPGLYAIRRGETLSQLLARAGGLTPFAYPQGAVFTREDLRRREQDRMRELATSLESEITLAQQTAQNDPDAAQNIGEARQILEKMRGVKAVGRLVIDLAAINQLVGSDKATNTDIVLKGGDKLHIPARMQEVSVIGQVFHPTSHLFKKSFNAYDYVNLSGGMTRKADESNVYVIRADGSVELARRYWLLHTASIQPGDTVVVPFNADYMSGLRLWTNVSQIFYQLALTAASMKTVGIL